MPAVLYNRVEGHREGETSYDLKSELRGLLFLIIILLVNIIMWKDHRNM